MSEQKLKVLDLFSGIGGFSLGLERTGGFETVAFCEIEEFPRKVLRKHWPEVPIYEDVRELSGARLAADGTSVDVVTGGFPCQDLSSAGRRNGIEGARSGLWSELFRIIGELRPKIAIMENVSALLSGSSERPGSWFGVVLSDLAKIGYDAEWHCIPAAAVGAEHYRERVWIIAYPNQNRWFHDRSIFSSNPTYVRMQRLSAEVLGTPCSKRALSNGNLPDLRKHDGVSIAVHRLGALGNAIVPQISELIGYAILEAERQAT